MKSLFVIALMLVFSVVAKADPISKKCYAKAETAVAETVVKSYYDKDGFDAYMCEVAENQKVIICEVTAMKGKGKATDTYRVVLNKSCTVDFRVDLIGEE